MYCIICGNPLPDNTQSCTKCGHNITDTEKKIIENSRKVNTKKGHSKKLTFFEAYAIATEKHSYLYKFAVIGSLIYSLAIITNIFGFFLYLLIGLLLAFGITLLITIFSTSKSMSIGSALTEGKTENVTNFQKSYSNEMVNDTMEDTHIININATLPTEITDQKKMNVQETKQAKDNEKSLGFGKFLLAAAAIIILVTIYNNYTSSGSLKSAISDTAGTILKNYEDTSVDALEERFAKEAWEVAKRMVKDDLYSPTSAQFPAYNKIQVFSVNNSDYENEYVFYLYVDHDNLFGTKTRTDYKVSVYKHDGNWYGNYLE